MVVLFLTPAALSKPIQRCELHATGHEWWLLVFLTSYTETACALSALQDLRKFSTLHALITL